MSVSFLPYTPRMGGWDICLPSTSFTVRCEEFIDTGGAPDMREVTTPDYCAELDLNIANGNWAALRECMDMHVPTDDEGYGITMEVRDMLEYAANALASVTLTGCYPSPRYEANEYITRQLCRIIWWCKAARARNVEWVGVY